MKIKQDKHGLWCVVDETNQQYAPFTIEKTAQEALEMIQAGYAGFDWFPLARLVEAKEGVTE